MNGAVHPGSGTIFFTIPDPCSRGQKGTGSRKNSIVLDFIVRPIRIRIGWATWIRIRICVHIELKSRIHIWSQLIRKLDPQQY